MSSTAIVLATDPGSGFDQPKYATPIRGQSMLDRVLDDVRSWPVDDVVVVLGPDADEVVQAVDLSDVTVLIDPEWSEGGAAPLRAALDLVSRDRSVRRIVLAAGDQPGVTAGTVDALIAAASGVDVAVPKYRYAIGWPIVMGRSTWDLFLGLEGDIDVHDVITAHHASIEEVWIDQLAPTRYRTASELPGDR
jgi:molybdenum cofactor cytidylyltransferase